MKILDVRSLKIEAVKVIRFGRFCDHRGYFTEQYRKSDFASGACADFMKGVEFVQANESFSHKGTIRGLHFQWNPCMGKLVRTLSGRMVDMALDIRKGSPTFGKAVMYDMPANHEAEHDEWIWVPPGFAHGNFFPEETLIEYLCSGQYSQGCESGISPLAGDIDWSACDRKLKGLFDQITASSPLITEKDRNAFSVAAWAKNKLSDNFIYGRL